jgi:hypothetical protein
MRDDDGRQGHGKGGGWAILNLFSRLILGLAVASHMVLLSKGAPLEVHFPQVGGGHSAYPYIYL